MKKRGIFVGVNSIKFNQKFKTDDDCLRYISEIKWEHGYICRRCHNDKFCNGKKFITEGLQNVDMKKAQPQEQYLTKLNFHF